jgi:hypothetical protein
VHVLPRQRFITSASVPSSPLRRPLFLPSPAETTLRYSITTHPTSFDISSTCCTYSPPLQCMILPPPRGDPSPPLHQSSSRLRKPERPKQKARCAPSLAAILVGSVARLVVTCPVVPRYIHMLITLRALSSRPPPSRNATNGQTQRAVARPVSVSASNASALARSAPIGSRYVACCASLSPVSRGSHAFCLLFSFIGEQ